MHAESVYQRCFIYAFPNICSPSERFEWHLVAEREPFPKYFAFNHINYSRYLTFHHVNYLETQHCNENILKDLLRGGFGGSLSGRPF